MLRTTVRLGLLGSVILTVIAVPPAAMAAGLRITSFTPLSGAVGHRVTIAGTGFSAADTVTLGGRPAAIVAATATRIHVTVPPLAVTGPVTVTDPTGLRVSGPAPFRVTAGLSVAPASVWPGGTFILAASGLTPDHVLPVTLKIGKKTLIVADLRTDQNGNANQNVAVAATLGPGRARIGVLDPNAGSVIATILLIGDWSTFHQDTLHQGVGSAPLLTPSAVTGLVKKWSFPTGGEVESSPAVVNGIVYFGSTDTHLYAVDATTGALVWRFDPGDAIVSSPTVSDGVVYLGTMGGGLFALDAATGHVDWGVTMDGPIEASPEVVGGIVYLTTTNNDLNDFAVDAATGAIIAHSGNEGIGTLTVRPNGVIYQYDDSLVAYERNPNFPNFGGVWFANGLGDATHPTPAILKNRVYTTAPNGSEDVYPVAGGTSPVPPTWTFSTSDSSPISSSPAVGGSGNSYFGSDDHNLWAVGAGGAFLWARDLGAPVDSSPAVADGVVYVGSEDDSLYAVDQTSGNVVWSYATGGQVESSPAVANNMVFVGSDDGSLYAFGLP